MNGLFAIYVCVSMITLAAASVTSDRSSLQAKDLRIDGPFPLHLLDLDHQVAPSPFLQWDLCSTVVHSNLGGLGPDSGAKELRFGAIGNFDGKVLDLVIENTSTYTVHDNLRNTARGCFGVINVAKDSSVDLSIFFAEPGTSTPVPLQTSYYFSMFDLDCSVTGCEEVTIKSGPPPFSLDPSSELVFQQTDAGLTFTGTTVGYGSDNPPPLEALQKSRSVSFHIVPGTATLEMTYTVQNSKIGRNFLFAGKTTMVKGTTTTTTLPGKEQCHDCIIWGDPHLITFDVEKKRKEQHPLREAFFRTRGWKNDQLNIYSEGTFWLVKSDRVQIQARFWHNKTHPDWTNLGALAVGGPFLAGHNLIIRPLSASTTWDGDEILYGIPSRFENEYVQARFHSHSEIVANGKRGVGTEFHLPEDVHLTVNRWKNSLAVKIAMCPQKGGQDGYCGNYNGNAKDDVQDMSAAPEAQRVLESEFIF